MEKLSAEVRRRLAELSGAFTEKLPERVAEIRALWADVEARCDDGTARDALRVAVHKLAGSAATFGYDRISTLAKDVEASMVALADVDAGELAGKMRRKVAALLSAATDSTHDGIADDVESLDALDSQESDVAGRPIVVIPASETRIPEDLEAHLGYFGLSARRTAAVADALNETSRPIVLLIHTETIRADRALRTEVATLRLNNPEQLSVIFVSDSDDFDVRLAAVRAGGDAFFSLPVDPAAVVDRIELFAERAQGRTPFHIMVVDDDRDQVGYMAMLLQQAGMITSVVSDPRNVFRVLVESQPELILMDMYMPGCSGLELAALIRQQEAFVGIPIVFLSVETDRAKQMEAIRRGADDFILKPVDPAHLITSLRFRAERTRRMRFFMERDSLTGLLNHTNLLQSLKQEARRAGRIGTLVSFAMIDIDRFKSVNDRYGHLTGDTVLRSLARLLQERFRKTDIIGRYGGEEFGVIMFDTDQSTAVRLMDEVREAFSRIEHHAGSVNFRCSFSAGVASSPAFEDAARLTEAADAALYRAKESGRNRVVAASLCVQTSPACSASMETSAESREPPPAST